MDENKMTELNKAIEGMWDSLTDEQKAKAKECKSMDELKTLAGKEGVELPDELLDAVAGGESYYEWLERTYWEEEPLSNYEKMLKEDELNRKIREVLC